MEKLKSQVNVTFWFWVMYTPPPGMEKLKSQVSVTFWFWLMYPSPQMEKLKYQVNVTFWFSGQSDILVLADVPPPPRN